MKYLDPTCHPQSIALSDQAGWRTYRFWRSREHNRISTPSTITPDLSSTVMFSKQDKVDRVIAALMRNRGHPKVFRRKHCGRKDTSCPVPDVDRGRSSRSVISMRRKGRLLLYEKPKASYFEQRSYDRKFWYRKKSPSLDPLVSQLVTTS